MVQHVSVFLSFHINWGGGNNSEKFDFSSQLNTFHLRKEKKKKLPSFGHCCSYTLNVMSIKCDRMLGRGLGALLR